MSPHVFALVALRLIAVYVVAQILFQLTYLASFSVGSDIRADSVHIWIIYGSCVVFGSGLWWLAPFLSMKAAGSPETVQKTDGAWTSRDVQRVALSLMGVWFVVQALPSLGFQLLTYVRMSDKVGDAPNLLEGLIPEGVQLLLGVLLILGASFWSELLVHIQQFGLSRKRHV